MTLLRDPRALIERLRGSLWVLPILSIMTAVALALLLVRVHVNTDGAVSDVVFSGGAAGARGLLQAVTTSVFTVTSLTFSLTVVTLQLASSQFSPRLLRTFLRDLGTQAVLSLFLATATYCLLVLRTIRSSGNNDEEFVPQLAVTVGIVLAIASIVGLVYFISHITAEIRIDTMVRNVDGETQDTINLVYPDHNDAQVEPESLRVPSNASAVLGLRSGFVQGIDTDSLLSTAVAHGLVMSLQRPIGQQTIAGAPAAWAWPIEPDAPLPDSHKLGVLVDKTLTIGFERTVAQDVPFGLRQLVDVAAKALSPGINDPTTAVTSIGHLTHLLCMLAGRLLSDGVHTDEAGRVRVVVPRHSFADFLDLACGQIRRYGAGEPDVTTALLTMLRDVGGCCRTEAQREAVRREIGLIVVAAERETAEPADLERVHAAAETARAATHAVWRPGVAAQRAGLGRG